MKFPNRVGYDHFSINRQVGQGGFGKVNACVLNRTKETFAIKTLSKKTILQSKNVLMIRNERDILSNLNPQSLWVAGMHYAFQNEKNCFLVLTLALGGDLRYHMNHVPEKRLEEKRVAFYTRCIVLALKEVHASNIIHRDVKPDNVVVKSNGYCVLTDFGISKLMEEDGTYTGSSGTRAYMPPEALQKPHVQSVKADSYSLGVLVYELIKEKKNLSYKSVISADRFSSKSNLDGKADLLDYNTLKASDNCKSFLRGTLLKSAEGRMSVDEMIAHPWLTEGIDCKKFGVQEAPAPWLPKENKAYCEKDEVADYSQAFGVSVPEKNENVVLPKEHDFGEFNGYDWNLTVPENS